EERNPAIADNQVTEATLHLKRVTLQARDASPNITHSVNLCANKLAIQVKRHHDKRRKRREARAPAAATAQAGPAPLDDEALLGGMADTGPQGVSSAA